MLNGFATDNPAAATGAGIVYLTYRSRTRGRLKVTIDFWPRIERFVKTSAKRSGSLAEFAERLKPRMGCEALRPTTGEDGQRAFPVALFEQPLAPPAEVIRTLYRETALCVLLVRERLEREKADREESQDDDTTTEAT